MSWSEIKLVAVLLISLSLWISEHYTRLPAALVAFLAMVSLVCLDVISWDDIAKNCKAWDVSC
jgi:DASS family divalent anion:Na+ symporter